MSYLRTGKGVCKMYTSIKRSLINYVKDYLPFSQVYGNSRVYHKRKNN